MLKIQDLVVSYGGVEPALKKITIDVPEGKIISLLGANGAGKSTTLRAISGLVKPKSGTIEFDGKLLNAMRPDQIVKLGIAHVPEGRDVFPGLSVVENLKMGAYANYKRASVERGMAQVFDLFPRLFERKTQLAGTMSGGEQQMLAIGRALMSAPKMLMLDEPSLGLAPIIVDDIFNKICEINKQMGMTLLLIEQNASLALDVCDYAYVMSVGSIAMQDESRNLLSNEKLMHSYLGGAEK